MDNPYAGVANSFNDLTRNLLVLKGQNMQNALSEAELAMRGNQFMETQRQNDIQNYGMPRDQVAPGTPTLAARQIANSEELAKIHKAALPIGQTDYSPSMHTRIMAQLKNKTGLGKSIDDFANTRLVPFSQDPNSRLDNVYDNIVSMDKNEINELLTNVANEHEAKLTKDPNYARTRQAQNTERFMDALYQAKDGSDLAAGFMPEVDRQRKLTAENSRAAILQATSAERTALANPETQFILNKSAQYRSAGMKPEDATVKAYEDLSAIRAKQAREGRPVNNFGIPAGIPAGRGVVPTKPGEFNASALDGLTQAQQDTVKAIVEYRFPVSNLRNKEMMALVQRAYAYDPTFDAKEYQTRAGVRRDFTSGKASQTILSLNTAVGHLNSLAKAANDLDNGSVQGWNKFRNALTTGLSDDSRVTKFNTTANAVAGELATVFKNTSGTDQEIKSWHDKISSSQTPKQLKDNIGEAIQLIGSRLEALNNKYEQGMGKKADFQLLSPKSREILKGLGVDVDKFDPASVTQKPAETPQRRSTDKVNSFRTKYNY